MMAKKTKKKIPPFVITILFTLGFLVMIYPLISRTYYDYRGNEEVSAYQEELAQVPTAEMQEKLQLAYAYNNALLSGNEQPIGDPFSEEEKVAGVSDYARLLEINEKLGVLTIPRIHTKFPVYAGTAESVLQKGVGHMEGTSLPIGGLTTHSVLTAHRGLPENKLFTDLDKMELDDIFLIETIAGVLAYKVNEIRVIEPTAIEELGIQKNKDLVTLLTCTPYMINSHRLIVVGERTELPVEVQEELTDISWWNRLFSLFSGYIWLIGILLIVLFFVGSGILKKRRGDQDENQVEEEH